MQSESLIYNLISSFLKQNVYTSIPGQIQKVTELNGSQVVDVKPCINRVFSDNTILEPSTIFNVPVVFPSGGGGILSFPLKVGDGVLIVFSMRSMEEWLEGDGNLVTPTDARHFNRSDAIAIPGIYTKNNNLSPSADNVELKFGTCTINITPQNIITISNGDSSFVLNGDDITVTAPGDITLNITGDANINANNVNIDASVTNLGVGGSPIARVGDTVQVNVVGGSSAGVHNGTITSGGNNNSI